MAAVTSGSPGLGRVRRSDLPYLSVEGYKGLSGIESQDATAGIQAALDTGEAVILPAGDWSIEGPIEVATELVGVGRATRLHIKDPSALIQLIDDRAAFRNMNIIVDITATGPVVDVLNYKGFWTIEDLFIYAGAGGTIYDGIKVSNGLSGRIAVCRVNSAANYGIDITNALAGYANDITVEACRVRNSGVADYRFHNGYGCRLLSSATEGTRPVGVLVANSDGTEINGLYAESPSAASAVSLRVTDSVGVTGIGGVLSLANKSIELTGASASCTFVGFRSLDDVTTHIAVGASCYDNTFITGYLNGGVSKISDSGTRTTIHANGGATNGSATVPGMRFAGAAATGFSTASSALYGIVGGATYLNVNSTGFSMARAGACGITLSDTDNGSRNSRISLATANGAFSIGPKAANGASYELIDPSARVLMNWAAAGSDDVTAMQLLVRQASTHTLQQVSIGAADSGGAGYRVLRVPN